MNRPRGKQILKIETKLKQFYRRVNPSCRTPLCRTRTLCTPLFQKKSNYLLEQIHNINNLIKHIYYSTIFQSKYFCALGISLIIIENLSHNQMKALGIL